MTLHLEYVILGGLTMVTSLNKFIKHVKNHCKQYNIVVLFTPWKSIKDDEDETIEGFFEVPGKKKKGKIKVAAGVPRTVWLHTLAHEYAHFEYWVKRGKFRKNYILDERLTERRALEILNEWKLPVNMKVRKKQSKKYLNSLEENI